LGSDEIAMQALTLSDNWKSLQFWICVALGVGSIIFSAKAFIEARGAKKAATKARTSLSIRNIENELGVEISILNGIPKSITYTEMRKICLDLTSKMARIKEIIIRLELIDESDVQRIEDVINNLNMALSQVKPDFEGGETKFYIFNGMSAVITDTSQILSTIIGKIQAKNLLEDTGDK